jgi:hypothetical protein
MKYLIILIILSFGVALLYVRLRPYIATARRILNLVREARRLNVNVKPNDTQTHPPAATNERLVHCAGCGAWLPTSRALILRATKAVYCSPTCLERSAGQTENRKAAN